MAEDERKRLESIELVYRHIYQEKVDQGKRWWRAFKPGRDGQLSVDRAALISLAESLRQFRRTQVGHGDSRPIAGACQLNVADIDRIGLAAYADPVVDPEFPNPAHAYIDFSLIDETGWDDCAKRLMAAAGDVLSG